MKKSGQGSFCCLEKSVEIACCIRILLDMNMRVHRFANNDINQAGCVKLKVRMEKMCGGLRPSVSEKIIPAICTPCFVIYLIRIRSLWFTTATEFKLKLL